MSWKIKDGYEVYVHPTGTGQIIGPMTFEELIENVIEGDTANDAAESDVICSFNPEAQMSLFDRVPEEQANSGASEPSEDRTSTYGGL